MDKEKVIKGLEYCTAPGRNCDMRCPYYDEDECEARLEQDALALLKEQKPVTVYESKISRCACGNTVNRYWHPKFCGYCGKELMWY